MGSNLCLGHAVRRFTLGAGELKRRSDRFQFLLRVLLVLSVVSAPAIGLAAGTAAHLALQSAAATNRAELQQVDAVVTASPQHRAGEMSEDRVWTSARWTAPDGTPVSGRVYVLASSGIGDTATIWVTPDGERRQAPLDDAQIAAQSVALGILGALLATFLAGLAYAGAVHLLDRARQQAWEAGWSVVEPAWRSQFR